MKKEVLNYLINLIPKCEAAISTGNENVPIYNCRKDCFKYSFLLYTFFSFPFFLAIGSGYVLT